MVSFYNQNELHSNMLLLCRAAGFQCLGKKNNCGDDIKGCLQAYWKEAVMMNVHAVLAAKGAIPNVCLSDGMEGRWGWVGCTETFALEVLCIDCDRISRD